MRPCLGPFLHPFPQRLHLCTPTPAARSPTYLSAPAVCEKKATPGKQGPPWLSSNWSGEDPRERGAQSVTWLSPPPTLSWTGLACPRVARQRDRIQYTQRTSTPLEVCGEPCVCDVTHHLPQRFKSKKRKNSGFYSGFKALLHWRGKCTGPSCSQACGQGSSSVFHTRPCWNQLSVHRSPKWLRTQQ